jgi:hypothetical protein
MNSARRTVTGATGSARAAGPVSQTPGTLSRGFGSLTNWARGGRMGCSMTCSGGAGVGWTLGAWTGVLFCVAGWSCNPVRTTPRSATRATGRDNQVNSIQRRFRTVGRRSVAR